MQKWLENNDIPINSRHNEDKPVTAIRFIKILKAKIDKKNDSQ